MNRSNGDVCSRAIAYLKAEACDGGPAVALAPPDEPVLRSLGNGLLAAYVVDVGDALNFVQCRHVLESGLTEGELHERAVANLLDLAGECLEIRSYKGAFVALMGGNFEASLLLTDSLWDENLARLAPNGFIAAAPARDVLAFCDAASSAGIAELRAIVGRAEAEAADHPLTPVLLRRQGTSWVRQAD